MRTSFLSSALLRRPLAWLSVVLIPLLLLGACKKDNSYSEFVEQQKATDDQAIRDWLSANNITNYSRRESGLYIIWRVEGTGTKAQVGKYALVKYIGRFLNGTRFDSSYESKDPCQCYSYRVGVDAVIQGWKEAFPLLRKGDEVELLIPSYLAYGTSTYNTVPANTPLHFEIKVIDVEQ